jgi:hypothetical protein
LFDVSAQDGSPGVLRIETLVDVAAVDKVRVEGVAGLGLSIAKAVLGAHTVSSIELAGAQLRNQSGDVTLSARSDADLTPAANTFSAGLINGAGAIANGSIVASNLIRVQAAGQAPAGITGDNVNLYAGRDAFGVSNQLLGSAHADMALASLFGIGVPVATMAIVENNLIDIGQQASLRAVQDVNLVAEPGLGGEGRAKTDGRVVKIGGTPYVAFALDGASVRSNNTVTVDASATMEAGINYRTQVQLLPFMVDGKRQLDDGRIGTDLTVAEKTALGLDAAQQYHYASLDLEDVALTLSAGTIVQVVPGANFGGGVVGPASVGR